MHIARACESGREWARVGESGRERARTCENVRDLGETCETCETGERSERVLVTDCAIVLDKFGQEWVEHDWLRLAYTDSLRHILLGC